MNEENVENTTKTININPEQFLDETTSDNTDYISENIIKFNTDSLSNIKLDYDQFLIGINEVSKLCGKITALVNVGITPSNALQYIAEEEGSKVAVEINKLNAETAEKTSKNNIITSQKSMI